MAGFARKIKYSAPVWMALGILAASPPSVRAAAETESNAPPPSKASPSPAPTPHADLPQPDGATAADIMLVFTHAEAPAQWSLKKCDVEFQHEMARQARTLEARDALALTKVREKPADYHWCFYAKLLELRAAEQNRGEKKKKGEEPHERRIYDFLRFIARAMKTEYGSERYLKALSRNYARAKKMQAFRNLPHPEDASLAAVMAVMASKGAVSRETLSSCSTPIDEYLLEKPPREDSTPKVSEIVRENPEFYHWCFYDRVLRMRLVDDNAKQGTRHVRSARKILDTLNALARAFRSEYLEERYLEAAEQHFRVATMPSDYRRLPHPGGGGIGEVMLIFTEKYAPSPADIRQCDSRYRALREELTESTLLMRALRREVRSDPVHYHWCFFGKILEAANPIGADDRAGQGRDDRILDAFLFISKVATAFFEEFNDPRYKIAAIGHYRQVSREAFFRALDTLPETTRELVQAYRNPAFFSDGNPTPGGAEGSGR